MKNYALYWCYRVQICHLKKKIKDVWLSHGERSAMSSRNFEFDHLVEQDVRPYKDKIFKIKRKMCKIR